MDFSDFDKTFRTFDDVANMVHEFENARLPPARWTHHAHLIVGTWYISRFEFDDAVSRIRIGIKSHNASVGTLDTPTSGYHETITIAWAGLIRCFILSRPAVHAESLELYRSVVKEFSDTRYLLRYYEKDVLMSVTARASWVEPDKGPLRLRTQNDDAKNNSRQTDPTEPEIQDTADFGAQGL